MMLSATLISISLNIISTAITFRMILDVRNFRYNMLFFNVLTISGASLLILNVETSNLFKVILFFALLFPAVLRDHISIFEPSNVGRRITILSFGYTRKDYLFKFLVPKNVPKLLGSFMKFFGIAILFLFLMNNVENLNESSKIGFILIILGVFVDSLNLLNIERR